MLLTVYSNDAPELRALEQDFTADAYFLKVMGEWVGLFHGTLFFLYSFQENTKT